MLFVTTGGTIDKQYPRAVGGYAFEFGSESAVQRIARLVGLSSAQIVSVCAKDSTELTDDDRRAVCEAIERSACKHVVVTHGTDTMIETAKQVDAVAKRVGAVVVFVGAAKPEVFKDTDAHFNVGVAVGAARALQTPGSFIAMNGRVLPAHRVKRNMETGEFEEI